MKILYFAPIRFPSERAHGAQIAHMCHAFSENGADVTLVVSRYKNSVTEPWTTYYCLPETFGVKYLSRTPWSLVSKFGLISNLVVYTIQAVVYALFHPADLIYGRTEGVLLLISFFVPAKKIVWESHEAKFNFAARNLFKKGVKCIVISEGIKEFYVQKGVLPDSVLVAHDGIDESFFNRLESKDTAQKRLGISSKKPIVMYIGGLDAWKGVDIFFEVSKEYERASFVVIGGTDAEVNDYKKRYSAVLFLGNRPYRELPNNQQAADVLVCTNTTRNDLSAKYTSPLKLFSYMTARVPLLAANVPSITSVVSDELVALYNPDSTESIVAALDNIFNLPDIAKQKADRAFEYSKEFMWKKRAKSILYFNSIKK